MAVSRIDRFQNEIKKRGIDTAIITSAESILYFTGYHGIVASPLVTLITSADGESRLLVPPAEAVLARASEVEVREYVPDPIGVFGTATACRSDLESLGASVRSLGLEMSNLSARAVRIYQEVFVQSELSDLTDHIALLRSIKDGEELSSIRRAALLANEALREALASTRGGISEAELRSIISHTAMIRGARHWPNAAIETLTNAVSGPNMTRLHSIGTGRQVSARDLVFLLATVRCDGYWADLARTVVVQGEKPITEALFAVRAASEAQAAAISTIRPGMTLASAKQSSIDVLSKYDLQSRLIFSMFRGLGLSTSESPGEGNLSLELASGMVLCVQVYLMFETFCAGLSDTVLVTPSGSETLTGVEWR